MCIAPKLCGCRVSMTYFINNHKILTTCFKNEEKTPWKHQSDCKCNDCNVYFFRMEFFQLEALFYCITNLVGKGPSQLDF